MIEFAKKCDVCGKGFFLEKTAPHKRFCSQKCRVEFHKNERNRALRELRERQEQKEREKNDLE